jgi:peptidoglycan/LPS O-acetylase OafA/YrhL
MTRNESFSLRGLACVLLVANHVVGGTPEEGLRLAAGLLREAVDAGAAIRMPLFACIAGLTHFHFKKSRSALLSDKVQRLLVPMLLTGTLFAVTQAVFAGQGLASINWLTLHWLPVAHYWFLESLFIIIVVWSFAQTLVAKAVFTALVCVAYGFGVGTPWLGLAGAVYLAPFFALGWWWAHAQPNTTSARSKGFAALATLAGVALIGYIGNPAAHRMTLAMLAAGALFCAALLTFRLDHAALRWIGQRSYVVFLFHVFFTAPTRSLLRAVQVDNGAVHLVVGVCAAVVGAAVLDRVLKHLGGPALWFIGEKATDPPLQRVHPAGSAHALGHKP